MRFSTILSTIMFGVSIDAAVTETVSFDQTYDQASNSLAIVACSNGANGLLTKGFTTFGSLPTFPNIGGSFAVAGFNSPNCGTCWNLSFNGTSINVLAIDHSVGFNIALEALNTLTNGNAVQLGRITATATQVAASACGL